MKIYEEFKNKLVKNNSKYNFLELENVKDIYLIFLSSWCPVTDYILLNLKEFYLKKNKNEINIEFIMIPQEDNKKEYEEFCYNLPWIIWEFNKEWIINIFDEFKIQRIPNFIKVNYKFEVINTYESVNFYINNLQNF